MPKTSGWPRRLMIYSHHPDSFKIQKDLRNGPGHLSGAPWEREYLRMKERGEYTDTFRAPVC
jgi:hypothetical protein